MLRIRMMRFGRKRQPSYRVVVLPRGTRSGRSKYVESLGWVDPIAHKNDINKDRANYWLAVGAQPSDTVWNLFVREGIVQGDKRKKGKAGISKEVEAVEEPKEAVAEPVQSEEGGDEKAEAPASEETPKEEAPDKNEKVEEETLKEKASEKKGKAKDEKASEEKKDVKEGEPAAEKAKEDTSTEETKKEGDS